MQNNQSTFDEVHWRTLTERVSIVYLNDTEVHAMNASQLDVIQLCRGSNCQPSLPREADSLAVVDLNSDGIMELVSYHSSYTLANGTKDARIASTVQVVKLQSVF